MAARAQISNLQLLNYPTFRAFASITELFNPRDAPTPENTNLKNWFICRLDWDSILKVVVYNSFPKMSPIIYLSISHHLYIKALASARGSEKRKKNRKKI